MKKISIIFGTRPEAIKMVPVILELKKRADVICRVCVTAQHRQMLDQVLDLFGIVPNVDLNLMRPNQSLGGLTSSAIEALDQYLADDKPDAVLVQGDTTTVLCAALAAFYHKIPVGHVEAGLRTGNMASPWPEEANRVLTTRLAKWHFAPTESNRQNLLKEGIADCNIYVTGNTVIDALFLAIQKVKEHPPGITGLPGECLDFLGDKRMVLITGHRRENFGDGFENICQAISELAEKFPDVHFIYPVHLNPNVRDPVQRILGCHITSNIHLIEPQSYLPFVALMSRACLILTDSGGIQEEAPSLGKRVFVLRETTERPEALATGAVKLIGTDQQRIVAEVTFALIASTDIQSLEKPYSPYGDGLSAGRIINVLCG